MRNVAVLGVGMIPFGRYPQHTLVDLLAAASLNALDDAGLSNVDAVLVATVGASVLQHQIAIASLLVDRLCLMPAAAEAVENGPASGASAIKMGVLAIASGYYDTVLVVGGEKMLVASSHELADFLAFMAHPQAEYPYGVTMTALAAMYTRLYMQRYLLTLRHLQAVSLKNHAMGALNPYACIRTPLDPELLEEEQTNPMIADPLHRYDVCPNSDGAAAVVLCTEEMARKTGKPYVVIAGFGQATDVYSMAQRADPLDLRAVTLAAQAAFRMAGLSPQDVDVAEVHDAFTILEIAISEHVGFFEKGEGGRAVLQGETSLRGSIPINVSGGLKARGHPLGATGVAQVVEIVWQLRHALPLERQVPQAQVGMTVNLGGFANHAVCFLLKRVEQGS